MISELSKECTSANIWLALAIYETIKSGVLIDIYYLVTRKPSPTRLLEESLTRLGIKRTVALLKRSLPAHVLEKLRNDLSRY